MRVSISEQGEAKSAELIGKAIASFRRAGQIEAHTISASNNKKVFLDSGDLPAWAPVAQDLQ